MQLMTSTAIISLLNITRYAARLALHLFGLPCCTFYSVTIIIILIIQYV